MSEKLTGGLKGNFSRFLPDSGLVLEGGNISGTNLFDLQVNGASKFRVDKNGTLKTNTITTNDAFYLLIQQGAGINHGQFWASGTAGALGDVNGAGFALGANYEFGWSGTNYDPVNIVDLKLARDAANILAQRRGVNAQTFRLYGTYTDASNYERLSLSANSTAAYVTAEEAGTGTARDLYLGANNATVVTVAANGNVGIGNSTPSTKLYVNGDTTIGSSFKFSSGTGPVLSTITVNYISLPGTGSLSGATPRIDSATGAGIKISASNGGGSYIEMKDATGGIILSGGNTGINNTAPTHTLSVNGNAFVNTSVTVGNSTVNATVNSTAFTGTANNTSFVGSVSAANVVSNTQLSSNLANYQTTAGLASNVATLTANNTSFVGSVSAANVVSNTQLSSNLANYAALAGATFTGPVAVNANVTITGNLVVTGTTFTANVTNLDVKDLNITVAKGAATNAATDTAGITVDTANIGWNYNFASNTWQSNVGITPSSNLSFNLGTSTLQWSNVYANNIIGSNVYGTLQTASQPNITANNTSFVGSVSAANVVSNTQLSSNLANYQTTAGLSANVATLTANNTNFVGTTSAANVVSNTQLSSNLANYQTTAGLSANVATLTANNTSFVGSVSAANVVSNTQLSSNLANYATTASLSAYQTTAGLSANVATLTANNTSFVGSVSAANVVSNTQLSSNLANYQTTAGLSANVATLTSNNATNLGGVAAASYVQNTDSRTLSGNLVFSANSTTFSNYVVLGSAAANGALQKFFSSVALSWNSKFENVGGSGWVRATVANASAISLSDSGLRFYTSASGATGLISDNERIIIDHSGNVGISNSAPNAKLAVTGTANISGNVAIGGVTTLSGNLILGSVGISANGGFGTANQVLTSNGTTVYWAAAAGGSAATQIRQSYTANGSQTVFTVTGGYTTSLLDVYVNGVKLLNGSDVDVTSGSTFTITPAPANTATVEVVGYSNVAVSLVTVNVAAQYAWTNTHSFSNTVTLTAVSANGTLGSANQALYSNGTSTYWANVVGGAGYYKGGSAAAGTVANANNIFRINAQVMSFDTTINGDENATCTGPLTVLAGRTLTVAAGGRIAIV